MSPHRLLLAPCISPASATSERQGISETLHLHAPPQSPAGPRCFRIRGDDPRALCFGPVAERLAIGVGEPLEPLHADIMKATSPSAFVPLCAPAAKAPCATRRRDSRASARRARRA